MLCISSKVVPFPWQRPEQQRGKFPDVYVKVKIQNFSQRKYKQFSFPWTSETMRPISYNSVSCGWLQFLIEVSIVGWSIYNLPLAVSRWHLVRQPEGLSILQTWVPHLTLSGLCPFFTVIHTDEILLHIPKSFHHEWPRNQNSRGMCQGASKANWAIS